MGSMLEGFKVQVPMPVPMPGERDAFDSPFLGIAWPRGRDSQLNLENLHNGIGCLFFFVVCFFSVTLWKDIFFPLIAGMIVGEANTFFAGEKVITRGTKIFEVKEGFMGKS